MEMLPSTHYWKDKQLVFCIKILLQSIGNRDANRLQWKETDALGITILPTMRWRRCESLTDVVGDLTVLELVLQVCWTMTCIANDLAATYLAR